MNFIFFIRLLQKKVFICSKGLSLVLITLFGSPTFAAGTFSTTNSIIQLPDSLTIPVNTVAGTVVWTSEYVTSDLTNTSTGSASFASLLTSSPTLSSYGNNVYQTGIDGLGFRFVGNFATNSVGGIQQFFCSSCNYTSYAWGATSNAVTQQVALQLVVTGAVGSGSLSLIGQTARVRYNYSSASVAAQTWYITISGETPVTATSCTVGTYDTTVDLGTVYTQNLKSVGTTSTPVDFSIGVTCNSTSLTPSITFSGTTDANVSSVFANTSSETGSATGVGVQLLYNNMAITPDSAVSLGKPISTSENAYIFSARMYQTLNPASAGSFIAPVTFTLDYSAN